MRETLKKTSIKKEADLHSLRHSYATHLLEDGLNIVTVKDLLGHADITATMVYLHVAQCQHLKPHSPPDTLYKIRRKNNKKGGGENAGKV
jgi:site-specific recombinase XerD